MTNAEHTPGPIHALGRIIRAVEAVNGRTLAGESVKAEDWFDIWRLCYDAREAVDVAPKLLEACEEMRAYLGQCSPPDDGTLADLDILNRADAAIAATKGK